MDVITLDAQPREPGRAAARRARRAGEVPCILYGPHQEPVAFRVRALALRPLIQSAETFRVALRLDGEEFDCILKDLDTHPVTDEPLHADFFALTAGEELRIEVPVMLVGKAIGVLEGGVLSQTLTEVVVRALPANIPGHIDLDVSALHIGQSVHVSDIQAQAYVIETDPGLTIATVTAPTVEPVAAEEAELLLEEEKILGAPAAGASDSPPAAG